MQIASYIYAFLFLLAKYLNISVNKLFCEVF